MGTELTTGDWGLVTHSVIQGFSTGGGGQYHDVKVTPSGALTVEADVVGTVSIEGTVQIAEPVTVEGTVALDAATLAALENVNATVSGSVSVNNFPTTQAVSGTVALDSATLAALETINVGNFPATQAVSATDLDIRNLSSAQDSVTVTGTVSVAPSQADTNVTGAWAYAAGTSGTVTLPAGSKVLQISATSLLGGSFTVNGGAAINIPANQQFTLEPRGNLVAPTIVFTSTTSYVVEYVS
jgi:hypothetical protein